MGDRAKVSYPYTERLRLEMSFKYRWKNGARPTRDQAATSDHLLDESQFSHPQDQAVAEEIARKTLGVPLQTPDAEGPVLPQAVPDSADVSKP